MESSEVYGEGMIPNAALAVGEAGRSEVEYLRGDGGLYEVVEVMCAVTRGARGCDTLMDEFVFGRGKRLVGDTDLAVRGAVVMSDEGGPRLGERSSGDLSRLTYVCDHLSETSALLLFPAFHRTTGSKTHSMLESSFPEREASRL